jgi:hypothetical protein
MNSSGMVVGYSAPAQWADRKGATATGFVYANGTLTPVGASGSLNIPLAVNSSGAVVGFTGNDAPLVLATPTEEPGFLFQDGVLQTLNAPGANMTFPTAINSSGQIAGIGVNATASPRVYETVLWNSGIPTVIGSQSTSNFLWPDAINDGGEIAGQYHINNGYTNFNPLLWASGQMQTPPFPPAISDAVVLALNASGAGAGWGSPFTLNYTTPIRYNTDGTVNDLDTSDQLNIGYAVGTCINDAGEIAGFGGMSTVKFDYVNTEDVYLEPNPFLSLLPWYPFNLLAPPTSDMLAFVFTGGVAYDLNTLIPSGSGWVLNDAVAINDAGQIAGTGFHNGLQRAFLLTPVSNPPAPSSVLPQFAFGGGWYSALYFSNLTESPISFPVSFMSDAGTPLTVPSVGGSTTQVNLAANGTAIIEAPNTGSLAQGYAAFTPPGGVFGYGVFRQSVPGQADQEAVVPLSGAGATSNTLIWDDTTMVTAVSIVNPSSNANTVNVTLWDEGGNIIGTSSVALPQNSKTAVTLRSLSGLSAMVGQRGSAQFTVSSGSVAVLGLRFNGLAFTSIPTTTSSAVSASRPSVLPQFAFGGGWYSALYFTNLTGSPVSFPVSFVSDAGAPLTVPSVGGSTTQVNLAANGTAIIEAPNTGTLAQGYASFTLPSGVFGYGVFRQSVPGKHDQEAVVPLSEQGATSNTLTWDDTTLVTAVSIVNPSSTANTVNVTLWDENGNTIGTSSIALPPNSKTAATLRSLPGLSGMVGQRGSAQFTVSSGSVAVLGLRFDGLAFTSIPTANPAPGASIANSSFQMH